MTSSVTGILVVGLVLSVRLGGGVAQGCKHSTLRQHDIALCHGQKQELFEKCAETSKGFVLNDLIISPNTNCKSNDLEYMESTCIRDVVNVTQFEFDEAVFNLLDQVSGKNEINSSTMELDQLSFTYKDQKLSLGKIAFKNVCRPRKKQEGIELVHMCAETKGSGNIVYIYLEGREKVATPTECRCKITLTDPAKLKALDIRLQDKDTRDCFPGVSLEMKTNVTEKLECEGRRARYGFEQLFSSDRNFDLVLKVPAGSFPTAAWIQAEGDDSMFVQCLEPQSRTSPDSDENENGSDAYVGIYAGVPLGVGAAIISIPIIYVIKKRQERRRGPNEEEVDMDPETGNEYEVPNIISETGNEYEVLKTTSNT